MKVILSRKGFDLENGGYSSPIMKDGRLISLPISSRRSDELRYSELLLDRETSYFDVMSQLNGEIRIKGNKEKLTKDTRCHCDPDIYQNIRSRRNGWRGCFGQSGKAQRHLELRIKENDLLLFYGRFKNVIELDNQYSFDKSSRSRHVIFGYLQIGYKFYPNVYDCG